MQAAFWNLLISPKHSTLISSTEVQLCRTPVPTGSYPTSANAQLRCLQLLCNGDQKVSLCVFFTSIQKIFACYSQGSIAVYVSESCTHVASRFFAQMQVAKFINQAGLRNGLMTVVKSTSTQPRTGITPDTCFRSLLSCDVNL